MTVHMALRSVLKLLSIILCLSSGLAVHVKGTVGPACDAGAHAAGISQPCASSGRSHSSTSITEPFGRSLAAPHDGRLLQQSGSTGTTLPSLLTNPISVTIDGQHVVGGGASSSRPTAVGSGIDVGLQFGQLLPSPSPSPAAGSADGSAPASADSSGVGDISVDADVPLPGAGGNSSSNSSSSGTAAAAAAEIQAAGTSATSSSGSGVRNLTGTASDNSSSSPPSMEAASSSRALLQPIDYTYIPYPSNDSQATVGPLGLPVNDLPGLNVTRWVMCAWSVSNFSSDEMLKDGAMERVQQMINRFMIIAPGQVQLAASANVTVGYAFAGTSNWGSAAWSAVETVSSSMAGGYDTTYIDLRSEKPEFGIKAGVFALSGNASIISKDRQLQAGRKLLRLAPVGASAGTVRCGALGGMGGCAAPAVSSRGLLQAAAAGTQDVWVMYSRMEPVNVTTLLNAMATACGGASMVQRADMTTTSCGDLTRDALGAAGVSIDDATYSQKLIDKPVVTLSIRLAVGISDAQAAAGADKQVADWLRNPTNIARAIELAGFGQPIGPDALVQWLQTPEIWVQKPGGTAAVPSYDPMSSPANVAGVAIGAAAFLAIVLVVAVLLINRSIAKRRAEAAAAKGDSDESAEQRHRRRRREGKRRYLMPELPPPASPGCASTSSSAAAAAAAGSCSPDDSAAADDILTPDQIRPAMKELGDSVTSAVRFEVEDGDGGSEPTAAGVGGECDGGNAPGSPFAATAAACMGVPAAAVPIGQRVLAARAALVAERQAAAAAAAGAGAHRLPPSPFSSPVPAGPAAAGSSSLGSSSLGSSHGSAGSTLPLLAQTADHHVVNVASSDAQQDGLISRRGGWIPKAAIPASVTAAATPFAAAAAAAAVASAEAASAVGSTALAAPDLQEVELQQFAQHAKQQHPGSSGSPGVAARRANTRASPFAVGYNFAGIADAAPSAASALELPAGVPAGSSGGSAAAAPPAGPQPSESTALPAEAAAAALHGQFHASSSGWASSSGDARSSTGSRGSSSDGSRQAIRSRAVHDSAAGALSKHGSAVLAIHHTPGEEGTL